MHAEVAPRQLDARPGLTQVVAVTVTNTSDVIGEFKVRVLGADPSWISVEDPTLSVEDPTVSLFPDESRTVLLEVTVPVGLPAGERVLSVQVRETTPPFADEIVPLTLVVPAVPSVSMRPDPMVVTAGRRARVGLLIANEGNTTLDRTLHGQDPDGNVTFAFEPAHVSLPPGANAVVEMRARARRPFAGSPLVRPMELRLLDADQVAALTRSQPAEPAEPADPLTAPALRLRRRRPRPRVSDDVPALAQSTFVQKPLVSRGSMSLVGLMVALTVFAIVITIALSRLVGQSAADRDLALRVAEARDSAQRGGGSSVSGTVSQLTNGQGAANINVTLFAADDTVNPLSATVTDSEGRWTVGDLPAGDYKAKFQGAGFSELWYPAALTSADAEVLTVGPGEPLKTESAALGGVPASIAGTIEGDDVSGATLTLKAHDAPTGGGSTTSPTGTPSVESVLAEATVKTLPIAADGTFDLVGVPSPETYDLLVEKEGYASSVQTIDVAAGEERTGVAITLRQGDGTISGKVLDSAGLPLPDASITATVGQAAVSTRSASGTGEFALESLPTPAVLTLVITAKDHVSQTLTVALNPAQALDGLAVTLDKSSGTVSGLVTIDADAQVDDFTPSAGGVLVSITDGTTTVQTATQSGTDDNPDIDGAWSVDTLPVPGDYTITLSRPDLASQTVALSLDAQGTVVSDQLDADGRLAVAMYSATGTVFGTVERRNVPGLGIGEATVQLVSNTATYSVVSASGPESSDEGYFQFDAVPPGTYTLQASSRGVAPATVIVQVVAGPSAPDSSGQLLLLDKPASLEVVVRGGAVGWVVELFRASDYPGLVYRTMDLPGNGRVTFEDIEAPLDYVVQVRRSRGGPVEGTANKPVRLSRSERVVINVGNP